MINPAKYYNPKPILSGSLLNVGVLLVSMNVAMGYLVAWEELIVSKVMRMEITWYIFW